MVEKRFEDMLWKNILRIKNENDEEFARYFLEARSEFLRLRLRQEPALRKIYLDAADRVADEIRHLKPTIGSLTRAHLMALEKSLRQEAERISQAIMKRLEEDLPQAVEAGAKPLFQQLLRALQEVDTGLDFLKLQRGFGDVNARAVEAIWARTRKGLRLSDRIWQAGENVRTSIRDIVQSAVARGQDAVKTAREVERYLKTGTPSREYVNMMQRMGKRVPGNLAYEALRLARTEMSMAFMEGIYAAGRVNPSYKGVRWMLSASHPLKDVCDELAEADLYNLGPGGYPVGEEPIIPHPNCLCFTIPLVEDTKEFVERLKRWRDDPALEPDLEKWYNEIYRGLSPGPMIVIKSAPKAAKVSPRWKPGKLPKSGFESVDEATEWAKATYSHIEWDFEGASIEAINPTISQFHKLAKKYPGVAARLKYVGTHRGANTPKPGFQWDPNIWAHAAPDGSYIGLNPAYYGDVVKFQSTLTISEQSSFHPYNCNSIESVMTHEFGHCVRNWLLESKQAFTRYVSADGFGLVEDTVRLWEIQHSKKLSGISGYACKDEHEAWAETFSAMYHSEGKYTIAKKMKALLTIVADSSKWRDDFDWIINAPEDERRAIIEELKKLRAKLGIK